MATRDIVEEAIKAINDNGNNTAVEVRDVLKKLLKYTETVPVQPTTHKLYAFSENIQGTNGANLKYSIRIIEKHSLNFTFQLIVGDNISDNIITFKHKTPIEYLKEIIPTTKQGVNFVIPVKGKNDIYRQVIVKLFLDKKNIVFRFMLQNIRQNEVVKPNDEILTSIHFHISKI